MFYTITEEICGKRIRSVDIPCIKVKIQTLQIIGSLTHTQSAVKRTLIGTIRGEIIDLAFPFRCAAGESSVFAEKNTVIAIERVLRDGD